MTSATGRPLRVLAITVLLAATSMVPAVAKDATPTPAPASVSAAATDLAAAVKAYQAGLTTRDEAVRVINEVFTAAVKVAKADYLKARAKATTAAAKAAASTLYRQSLTLATEARQAAIDDLVLLPATPAAKAAAPTLKPSTSSSKSSKS